MKNESSAKTCNIMKIDETKPELKVHYQSAEGSPKGSIAFVHGICHGEWCWENFMEYFPENGYECFALNLRGHGSNARTDLKGARLSGYVDDVKRCIDYCKSKTGIKPFILGHSMGGAVVQQYIGKYSDTVKGAILFASATTGGMNRWKTIGDIICKKNLGIAALKSFGRNVTDDQIAISAFFDGRIDSKEDIRRYNALLHKESYWILLWDLYKEYTDNYKLKIPVYVIGSEKDAYFPRKSLEKTAQKYGLDINNPEECNVLDDLCHDMMLDPDWLKAAKPVLDFLDKHR